jgi:uncharacterized heparinase superfamily protein
MYIRTTKTSSRSTAVQVVHYVHRRREVLAHIGSAKNEDDLLSLKKIASDWIHGKSNEQTSLVPHFNEQMLSTIVQIDKCQYRGFRYQLFYDCLWSLAVKFKFHLISESETKMVKILYQTKNLYSH